MVTMQQGRNQRGSTLRRFNLAVAAALVTALAAATVSLPAVPAAAQSGCRQRPAPADPVPELPWAQSWFSPERIWPLSRGSEVVVAVIDSGVDADHPQLEGGHILSGTDLLEEPAGAHVDCDSHGTAVASIIAAAPIEGVGFAGLAPDALILPVRVAERGADATDPQQAPPVEPEVFATAIRWAVDHDARVINASIVFYRDHPVIADAIAEAVDRGVVVVAAVGDPPSAGTVVTPYPAAYPGVVGVGAVGYDTAGRLTTSSYAGPHVDLVAPGVAVTAAVAGGEGHTYWSGSSFAAPFVSAAVALLLAAEPDLTGLEAVERLFATADPGPGSNEASGHGVVNPYRALTERLTDGEPAEAAPLPEVAVDPVAEARAERWRRASMLAATITLAIVTVVGLAVGGRAVARRGHARGWRPVRQPLRPTETPVVEAPERLFFTIPSPRGRR